MARFGTHWLVSRNLVAYIKLDVTVLANVGEFDLLLEKAVAEITAE